MVGPTLGTKGDVALATGTVSTGDKGTTRFGVVTIGGTTGGVEVLLKTSAAGVFEGCAIGGGTGAI